MTDYPPPTTPDGRARLLGSLVTMKQLALIRLLCRKLQRHPDELAQHSYQCKAEELSRDVAGRFINWLQWKDARAKEAS